MNDKIQRSPYSEFLKELLGAVFPGTFLLFSLVFICFGPVLLIDILIKQPQSNILAFLKTENVLSQYLTISSTLSVLILFLIFSFVFGTIYYRRTCDLPNQYSIYKLLSKDYTFLSLVNRSDRFFSYKKMKRFICDYLNEHLHRVKTIDSYIRDNYAINGLYSIGIILADVIDTERSKQEIARNKKQFKTVRKYFYVPMKYCAKDCDINVSVDYHDKDNKGTYKYNRKFIVGHKEISTKYPFCCIRKYLNNKGYEEIANSINCPNNKAQRNYINEIKTNNRDNVTAISELEKIEAHIRYSSSMWYISRSAIKLANIMLLIFTSALALIIGLSIYNKNMNCFYSTLWNNIYFVSFLLVMFISCYFVCFRMLNYIENYLHNQRIIEMIMALQISHGIN